MTASSPLHAPSIATQQPALHGAGLSFNPFPFRRVHGVTRPFWGISSRLTGCPPQGGRSCPFHSRARTCRQARGGRAVLRVAFPLTMIGLA